MAPRLIGLALGLVLGLMAASQAFAWIYGWADALGPALRLGPDVGVYPPWSILVWKAEFGLEARTVVSRCAPLILLGAVGGLGIGTVLGDGGSARRIRGWGGVKDAREAGLLLKGGAVLGLLNGRLLATTDLRPTLVTGGTRSGKGRGHVTPTLLSWSESVLVHDPKRELWSVTAGWRSRFSHALYFDPRDPASACWNPLAEIQPGPGELAQVQRLVAILSDPGGARDDEAIWDKAASEILEAVILHVLYTAEDRDKSLLKVRELLADLDDAADVMVKTLHRPGAGGEAETHPFIRTAVKGYAAMHDRFRTSVQGTARSYLKWLAGEDLERVLSASDFAMGDLMCAEAPLSLYVQVAPADAAALRPLVRLLFYAAAQSLTAEESRDATGRNKRHKLLMVMRPDRIVVGEMRDGAAALETLKSWNTGHPGGLSTIHANSAEDVLRRIEDLTAEVSVRPPRRAIGQAIDRIVHIARTAQGRRVEAVLKVDGTVGDEYRVERVA